jgi:autotransporter passenger strand-loop-strand repeat protein
VISAGGQQNITVGARAGATLLTSGGLVLDAGIATSVTISGAGGLYVLSGGVTTSTFVESGGTDIVQAGGIASASTVFNGGVEVVFGTSISATITSGGREFVSSGGVVSVATISGGLLDVQSGGSTGAGPVTFAANAGGTLRLEDSIHFSGLVAGFSQPDLLYLKDIAFISGTTSATWTQSGTSGTLAVTDGTHTADITLLGQYSTANFHVSSGTQGGTIVSDPPVVTQSDQQSTGLVSPKPA